MPVDKKRVKEKQEDEIIDRTAPPGEVIYEAVYAEGEHELERNSLELAFSGLAAGLSMGFSMVTEGILQNHLPNATWQPLITKLGYSVGFLVVILGRQQLFTKNTLTVILPLLRKKKIDIVFNVARLWAIVLIGNLIGAFVFAWLAGNSNIFSPEIRDTFSKIGQIVDAGGFLDDCHARCSVRLVDRADGLAVAVRGVGQTLGHHYFGLRRRHRANCRTSSREPLNPSTLSRPAHSVSGIRSDRTYCLLSSVT